MYEYGPGKQGGYILWTSSSRKAKGIHFVNFIVQESKEDTFRELHRPGKQRRYILRTSSRKAKKIQFCGPSSRKAKRIHFVDFRPAKFQKWIGV